MKNDYERVSSINRWKDYLLYMSTIITVLLTINEKYNFSGSNLEYKDYIELAIGINSMLVFLYLWIDIRSNLIYSKAERNRTLQYLDNSFNTNFADSSLISYFTQEHLNHGFFKFSVNCFENTFHSFYVTKQMQLGVYIKAIIVLSIFMFSAAVGEKGIARYLIEAILPLSLVQSAIKLSIFVSRLENLLDTFRSFFSSIQQSSFEDREPEALKNVITYETILAWASIPLDSKVFERLKEPLASEWQSMKVKYKLV